MNDLAAEYEILADRAASKAARACPKRPNRAPTDTTSQGNWGCIWNDVTLTLKQARQPDSGGWVKIDDYRCRQAFRHFMNLLNRAVYGAAFRRHGKRLRVLPVLEKGEVRARALRSWDRGTSGRWHIHCAIELPSHFDGIALENLIRDCWVKVEWGYGRILVRDGANAGWINYMLKDRQKSEFDGFVDCIIIKSCTIQLLTRSRSFGMDPSSTRPKQGRLVSSRLVFAAPGAAAAATSVHPERPSSIVRPKEDR